MPDLFRSPKFLGFLTRIKPVLLKMLRKTDKILNNLIKNHKKGKLLNVSSACYLSLTREWTPPETCNTFSVRREVSF